MALTPAEKELLAVVRYYNENKKAVAKLVTKLMKDFNLGDVKALTSLNGDEIMKFQEMTFRPPKLKHPEPNAFAKARMEALEPSKVTKKVQASIREASAELDAPQRKRATLEDSLPPVESTFMEDIDTPKVGEKVIVLDADSPLHERIAYDMAKQIGDKFQKGDTFYTTKTAMEAFEFQGAGKLTIQGALKLLKEKGLIEYRNGNYRNGYVVV